MAKEINLTSQKWNDIIFEGKNKDYGAYEMRQSSSRRHVIAFGFIVAFAIFVSFLPSLIDTITAGRRVADNLSESTVLADLQRELEEQIQEKDQIRDQAPPPPPMQATVQFTTPEIVPEEMLDDKELKSQDELTESKAQISIADVEGVEKGGIDIADLQQHQVIAEEPEKIHEFVEQMPAFPEGDVRKYLASKLVYPMAAIENGISGRVTLQFVVGKDGSISDIVVLKGVDRSLDAEAVRVVKAMPKWIPGKQNGQTVIVKYTLPVTFDLKNSR